jgi:hypothetical protein
MFRYTPPEVSAILQKRALRLPASFTEKEWRCLLSSWTSFLAEFPDSILVGKAVYEGYSGISVVLRSGVQVDSVDDRLVSLIRSAENESMVGLSVVLAADVAEYPTISSISLATSEFVVLLIVDLADGRSAKNRLPKRVKDLFYKPKCTKVFYSESEAELAVLNGALENTFGVKLMSGHSENLSQHPIARAYAADFGHSSLVDFYYIAAVSIVNFDPVRYPVDLFPPRQFGEELKPSEQRYLVDSSWMLMLARFRLEEFLYEVQVFRARVDLAKSASYIREVSDALLAPGSLSSKELGKHSHESSARIQSRVRRRI